MALECKCGSTYFKPIGIQEGWQGKDSAENPQMLFLVNCLVCGTTIACNSLDYALMQTQVAEEAIEMPFYTNE